MVIKTLCPFCSYGCELGIVFDDFGMKGVEYLKDSPNNGRLCPRGSAAASYLNHPMRLSSPIKNNKYLTWQKSQREIKKVLEKPKEMAVTFDKNLTCEEFGVIMQFCEKMGIDNTASSYFEPEILLSQFLDENNPFDLNEINEAQMIFIIGDLFSFVPVISKHIIEWKYKDRKNRLVVIDSIGSYTAKFANDFLRVKVGYEPLFIMALAGEKIRNLGIPDLTVAKIANNLKEKNGLIFVVLPFAHTYDPFLLGHSLFRLRQYTSKKVVPFFEFSGFSGNKNFGDIIDLVKARKLKYLFNFGENFPFHYPQIVKQLKGANIIATSILKTKDYNCLPVVLGLEKSGTVLTTFGRRKISQEFNPASGTKNIIEIMSLFTSLDGKREMPRPIKFEIDATQRINKIVDQTEIKETPLENASSFRKGSLTRFTLIGEKNAFNFLGFWEPERIRINPLDANSLSVKPGEKVCVESKSGKGEFEIELSEANPPGLLSIPAETNLSKGIFDFVVDKEVIFIPTEVKIWRKG